MISAVPLPSDADCFGKSASANNLAALEQLRVQAFLRLSVHQQEGCTRLLDLAEGGGYRIKFPSVAPNQAMDAVIVNTGGGLLGADSFTMRVDVGAGAALMVTTQSAEKVYRTIQEASRVTIELTLQNAATLHWMPQECILFDGAALKRQIHATMAQDSTLLIAESMTFGRLAMGEIMGAGLFKDRWRIKRGENLVFADDFSLDGAIATKLDHPAIGGGARGMATLLLLAPDAEARLEPIREIIRQDAVESGASAWNGMLLVRMMAADPALVRTAMIRTLTQIRGLPAPRSW